MAGLWTVVIMMLCWIPGSMVRDIEDGSPWFEIPDLDKLVHGGIFILFSILWGRVSTSRRRFAWIALAGLGLAVLTEVVQKLPIIGRDGSIADTVIDVAGVLVGLAAASLVEPIARAFESRLFRESSAGAIPPRATTKKVEGVAGPLA
jgi:hypothetical protein